MVFRDKQQFFPTKSSILAMSNLVKNTNLVYTYNFVLLFPQAVANIKINAINKKESSYSVVFLHASTFVKAAYVIQYGTSLLNTFYWIIMIYHKNSDSLFMFYFWFRKKYLYRSHNKSLGMDQSRYTHPVVY